MAFTRSGTSGAGGGTELASGYIALTVHYNSAMQQISRDFTGLEAKAAVSGEKAGAALSNSFGKRMGVDMAAQGRYALNTAGIDMERRANQIGATVGTAIGRGISAPLGAITGIFRKAADDGGKALREGLTEHVKELASQNIALRQSVLEASTAYQMLKSRAAAPMSELTAAHVKLLETQRDGDVAIRKAGQSYAALKSNATTPVAELAAAHQKLLDVQNLSNAAALKASQAYETLKAQSTAPVAELTAAHQRLIVAQTQAKQGAIDLANAHQQLRGTAKAAVEESSGKFKELKSAIGESVESVGALGLEAEAVTGKVGSIGGALIALATNPLTAVAAVGAAIIGITTALFDMGEQWEHTFHQIEIHTGATGSKLEELEGSIKRVVGTVPQSIASVGNVTAYVATRFKDTGGSIAEVTRNIEEMQSMFGAIDLSKLGRAFNAFSLGGKPKEQIDMLKQLGAASQATQTPINELITILAKSPGALREFHLSMAESVSLLSEFDKSGIDPKTVQFTLSRAATLAGKAGKDLNVALTDSLNEIKKTLDTQGQDAAEILAGHLYGPTSARGGGGTIVAALMAGFDPNVIKDWANQAGIDIHGLYEKSKELPQVWGELKGKIAEALAPVAIPVFKEIEGFFTRIASWIGAHKDELPQMFVDAAVGAEKFAAEALTTFGHIGHALGDVLHAMGTAFGSDSLKAAGDSINGAATGMENLSNGITKPGGTIDATKEFGENLKITAKLTKAVGDAVVELNGEGGIEIKDATPQAIQNLKDLKINVEQIGDDPTHIKIIPDTPAAIEVINAMRREQGKEPIFIPISGKANIPGLQLALDGVNEYFKAHPAQIPLTVEGTVTAPHGVSVPFGTNSPEQPGNGPWFLGSGTGQPNFWTGTPPKLDGGITHFAWGGQLPNQAKVQSAVHPTGLVQWAEPGTGGEAFIPLAPAKRSRSLSIWAQTGKLLGMDSGGFATADPRGSDPHGSRGPDGGWENSLGPFAPWWNMDWMPPEHPERVGPSMPGVEGKWWHHGPIGNITGGGGRWFPPIGKSRKPLPGEPWPGWGGGDSRIKTWADGGISGVLQVIYANPATGQKTGEAGGQMVGPGTSQPGYYSKDWGGHTGHVHTSFATGLGGQPYGLPKGTDIRQGASGFPAWVYSLGRQFGLEASTYPGHQEGSGFNRGIDWWPAKHADMSGSSYTAEERNRLQSFASYVSSVGSSAMWGTQQGVRAMVGNRPNETGGGLGDLSGFRGGGGSRFGGGGMPTGMGFGGFPADSGMGDINVGDTGSGSTSPVGNDPVSAIVAEGRKRGYSDEQLAWVVADAKGESGLNPDITNASGHKGLFQQDSGYAGRDTMMGQITGFFDRLDATSPSMSIGDRISKSPAQGGVEGGGYGPDWIAQFLPAAKGAVAAVSGINAVTAQANDAMIAAGDAKIKKLQGELDVARQQLQEAQDKPLGTGTKAQETHDRAIATAQDRIDKLQNDLGGAQIDRNNMDDLSSGDPRILVGAQNRVTDALTRQADAQAKLDAARADPATKPSEITKDTNALASATDAVTAARARLGDVQTKLQTPKKGGKTTVTNPDGTTTTTSGSASSAMSGLPDFGALADIGLKGVTESFLPPGFMNPMDSPILKGVGGVLKFLSGLGAKHGGPLGGVTGGVLGMLGGFASGSPSSGISSLIQSFQSQPAGNIVPGSPGQAPYMDPTQLFSGSGSVGIMPGQLPGMNSAFPQGSPATGTGSGALPGPAQGQDAIPPGVHNDFRGANFQGDPGGVKGVVDNGKLAHDRKIGTFDPQRPGQ